MFDDYQSHRYPASPSSASSSTSSSSSSSCRLSLKNFHVGRRAATTTTTTTTAAEIDIAHILDPAYYSPKHHTMSSNQIYVDTTGETHDPDFRLFASSATHSPKRREFLSILSNTNNEDGNDEDNSYYHHYNNSFWGDEDKENRRYRQRSSFDSYRSPSRASDPIYTYSNYQHFDQSYAYRPTNEWQEEPDVFSLSEEEKERQPRSQTRSHRESNKLRRRRAESESEEVEENFNVEELWQDDERVNCDMHEDFDDESEKKGRQARSLSPLSASTTHSFRRQWLALRLRTQFAAFRARRKMTTLVKCATAAA